MERQDDLTEIDDLTKSPGLGVTIEGTSNVVDCYQVLLNQALSGSQLPLNIVYVTCTLKPSHNQHHQSKGEGTIWLKVTDRRSTTRKVEEIIPIAGIKFENSCQKYSCCKICRYRGCSRRRWANPVLDSDIFCFF
jgi:hypothetical protein